MMMPIVRSGALYALYEKAARSPRWLGRPFAMVTEYGPEHMAVALRDDVINYPPLQEAMTAGECMCTNCSNGIMSIVAWSQEQLMDDLDQIEKATIARSQRR